MAAAGNEGAQQDGVTFAPANDPWVITAGALDDKATWMRGDDSLAPWSSRGLTQDGVRKPDVLAPGVGLVSTLAPGSDFVDLCPSCVVDGRYFRAGGTSMAAAVVVRRRGAADRGASGLDPGSGQGRACRHPGRRAGRRRRHRLRRGSVGERHRKVSLPPNELIDTATRMIDWTRASFRRVSFRDASGTPYGTTWSRASFRCECGFTDSGEVDPNRVSFRRVSFRKTTDFGW